MSPIIFYAGYSYFWYTVIPPSNSIRYDSLKSQPLSLHLALALNLNEDARVHVHIKAARMRHRHAHRSVGRPRIIHIFLFRKIIDRYVIETPLYFV